MIIVNQTIEDLLSRNAADSAFLPMLFAGYAVNSANKSSMSPKSFTSNFCNGLNGAFVYDSLVNWLPIIAQYAKPLTDRVANLFHEYTLSHLATLLTMSYEILTNISSYPLMLTGCGLGALIFYRKTLQIIFPIIFSAIMAKFVVNCLNNLGSNFVSALYIVNLIYFLCPKSTSGKEIKVSYLEQQMLSFCEQIYNYKKKNPSSNEDKAIVAILNARKNDEAFKEATNDFINDKIIEKIKQYGIHFGNKATKINTSGGIHKIYSAENVSGELSAQNIREFLNSQPSKKELMYFCEEIYRSRIINNTQPSLIDQFSLVVMNHRMHNIAFRESTDAYFEELFDKQVLKAIDICEPIGFTIWRYRTVIPNDTVIDFMKSNPTKEKFMEFGERILGIKMMNNDNRTWGDTICLIGIQFRAHFVLLRQLTNYVAVESFFDQQVCNKIYSFINQKK